MIVNNTNEGWEIIYQKAHGLLAAALAQHWRNDERPQRWTETIIAISDHDDNQQKWHGKHHLTMQGTPQDFALQPPDLKQAQQVIEASKFKSGWMAVLISEHFSNLYQTAASENKKMKQFLQTQQKFRQQIRKELKISEPELKQAYKLMYWCDRTSLILCKNQIPPDEKFLEIGEGPGNTRYTIKQVADGSIQILPWPFEVDTFTATVEARMVETVVFEDDRQLRDALEKSPVRQKTWRLRKA